MAKLIPFVSRTMEFTTSVLSTLALVLHRNWTRTVTDFTQIRQDTTILSTGSREWRLRRVISSKEQQVLELRWAKIETEIEHVL